MRRNSNFFRFFCAALLTLATAVGLARWSVLEIEAVTANTNLFMRLRLREMIADLPKIAATPGPIALVFGASDMEIGFHPDRFDQAFFEKGKKMTSFNLSVRNGTAVLSEVVSRVAENGIRPSIVIVKFSPSLMTKAAKPMWNISDDVRSSFVHGWDLLAERSIFDGMSPAMARFYIADWFNSDRKFKWSKDSPLLFRNRILNAEPAWDFSRRGFFYFGTPKTQNVFDHILTNYLKPDVQAAVTSYHLRCCDAETLNFDVGLVQNFVASVRELHRISKRTILLYYPDNITRSAAAELKLRQTIEATAKQGGAELLWIDKIFTQNDYIDVLHLSWSGGIKLSKQMGEILSR